MTRLVSPGDVAPDFTLDADGSRQLTLSSYRPRNVVIFFYPRDNTSGCTREAKDFTRLKEDFAQANTQIIGISADSVASHEKFKQKQDLTVDLASDPEKSVLSDYGVWVEKKMYGRTFLGIERATYLIDGTGRVSKIWRKVKVPGHAEDVLGAAQTLNEARQTV